MPKSNSSSKSSQETRQEAGVETPASIRSSIGMARLAAERARRENATMDNRYLAQAAWLTLRESVCMKPGREIDSYLNKLLKRILGVTV